MWNCLTALSIVMHAERKEGYIGSSFTNYINKKLSEQKREKTTQNGAFVCKCCQRIKPQNYEKHKEGRAHISQINEFIKFRESFIKSNIEDDNYISNLPNEIKENNEQRRLHIIRKCWYLEQIRHSFEIAFHNTNMRIN